MSRPDDDSVDIFGLASIVWRRKAAIAIFLLLSQAVAVMVYLKTPARYQSQSQFIFKTGAGDERLSSLAALVGVSAGGSSKSDISAYFDVILFTDEFIERILLKKWKVGPDSVTLAGLWSVPDTASGPMAEYRRMKGLIHRFRKGKHVVIDKSVRPGLIGLKTSFDQPEIAYESNRYIVSLLNEYLLNNNKSQASENRKFVETRLKEVERELKANEDQFLSFSLANQSISSPALMLAATRHKRAVEISQEVFLQLKKQVELAKIDERKEAPLIEVIADAQYPLGANARLGAKAWIVVTVAGAALGVIAALLWHFLATARSRGRGA